MLLSSRRLQWQGSPAEVLTEANLSATYGLSMRVMPHPLHQGRLLVLPPCGPPPLPEVSSPQVAACAEAVAVLAAIDAAGVAADARLELARFRAEREELLRFNDNFYFRGYGEILRRFTFRPVFDPIHPKW